MGPHGPAKCLLKVVEKLSERFTALEDQNARLSEELDHLDKLHAERQRTFLATIEELEESTASLEQTITLLRRSQEGADTAVDSSPPSACAEGSSDSTLIWTSATQASAYSDHTSDAQVFGCGPVAGSGEAKSDLYQVSSRTQFQAATLPHFMSCGYRSRFRWLRA